MSMKSIKFSVLLMITGLTLSCSQKSTDSFVVKVNYATKKQLNLSDYAVSLEYVPLETNDDCLIDKNPNFYLLDEYIVVTTWRQCFLFARNGKYICEIGHPGNGPNEYARTLQGEVVNDKYKTIIMVGSTGNGLVYSFNNGNVIENFPLAPNMRETAYVSDNLWIQGINNINGDAINQLVFANRSDFIDSIPNKQLYQIEHTSMRASFPEHYFYRHNDELYYKNLFNDTIYCIRDIELHTAWVFDMGNFHLPFSIKANPETAFNEIKKYNQVEKIMETDQFLFFSIKREDEDNAFIFNKNTGLTIELSKDQNLKGFYNDIDGGIPFWPNRISRNQEMVTFLYPYYMKEIYTDEYLKNKSNESAYLQLKNLLSRLNDEDNPVVLIAKLRNNNYDQK